MKKLIKRNLIANYAGQMWVAFIGLAFIPTYIKILGIEAYGIIGIFSVIQAWMFMLDMGMTPTLGREMASIQNNPASRQGVRDLLRTIEILAVVLSVGVIILLALSASWISAVWLKPAQISKGTIVHSFQIMGIVVALRFLEGLYRSSLVGLQRQVLFNTVSAATATLRAVGAVVALKYISPTLEMFFIWQAIISLLSTLVLAACSYVYLPKAPLKAKFSVPSLKRVKNFAIGMIGVNIMTSIFTQSDKVFVSNQIELKSVGYYMLATTLSGSLFMLVGPITQAYYPNFCRLHSEGNEKALINSFRGGSNLVAIIVGSAASILSIFGSYIVLIWTDDVAMAQASGAILTLLAIGNLVNAITWTPLQLQLAHGWTTLASRSMAVSLMLGAPLYFLLSNGYGAIGVASTWVFINILYLAFVTSQMFKKIARGIRFQWMVSDTTYPILAAFITSYLCAKLYPSEVEKSMQIIFIFACGATVLLVASAPTMLRVKNKFISQN
ncbi:lipopolysaccharide biosynthesis protein [Pseudacidovorax sp. RU35E]|jgi:O-antigen/teichoic acid export membrane protein|uniref:lipopolysaccharide biosynthesis protein n=1 Tax=Pseudacidovorax sp. RU35E TaxID=1907403 RepID=UPI00095735FD|nr:oligosaccharide flippase family protein [Pseudacidovorax sp. RU35E]SIP95873.1 Membrane protein involved in the export of O-antigen and teichoic acid [Pseudacidovorax sp. RU35E]